MGDAVLGLEYMHGWCWRLSAERRWARDLEFGEVLGGMVRGSGQRARGHQQEALVFGDALMRLELVRRDETIDGGVLPGRLQILADGEDVDIDGAEIVHHRQHVVARLAEPDHDAGLGEKPRVERLGAREQI